MSKTPTQNDWEKEDFCKSKYATRPILYTDTIQGNQVLRDDMWAVSTKELNEIAKELADAWREVINEIEKKVEEENDMVIQVGTGRPEEDTLYDELFKRGVDWGQIEFFEKVKRVLATLRKETK